MTKPTDAEVREAVEKAEEYIYDMIFAGNLAAAKVFRTLLASHAELERRCEDMETDAIRDDVEIQKLIEERNAALDETVELRRLLARAHQAMGGYKP